MGFRASVLHGSMGSDDPNTKETPEPTDQKQLCKPVSHPAACKTLDFLLPVVKVVAALRDFCLSRRVHSREDKSSDWEAILYYSLATFLARQSDDDFKRFWLQQKACCTSNPYEREA